MGLTTQRDSAQSLARHGIERSKLSQRTLTNVELGNPVQGEVPEFFV
jgi:hypothetical protein